MKRLPKSYHLSAVLPSPPLSFESAVTEARLAGFDYVDLIGLLERPAYHLEVLADSGLIVSCGALGRGLPDENVLDSPVTSIRRTTLDMMKSQVGDVARLGATHAFLGPGNDSSVQGLARFGEACRLLADYAGQRMVQLCVAHVPSSALPNVRSTLEWLEQVGHEDIGLMLDVEHAGLGNEDAVTLIARAGARLRYVRLNHNAEAALTLAKLKTILAGLVASPYPGTLALGLRASAVQAMSRQRELLQHLLVEMQEGREI